MLQLELIVDKNSAGRKSNCETASLHSIYKAQNVAAEHFIQIDAGETERFDFTEFVSRHPKREIAAEQQSLWPVILDKMQHVFSGSQGGVGIGIDSLPDTSLFQCVIATV